MNSPTRRIPAPLAAISLALLLVAGCGDENRPDHAATASGAAERAPVIVIGVDGAEWRVIEGMVANGELPGFKRLMDEGATGHLLNPGPQVSPVVWTTFATGHFSRDHGILDFVYPYGEGAKRPVDASLRREPALWSLLDAYGGESTVIGYFVSHPAESIDGRIVTDRAFQGLPKSVWPEALEPLAQRNREGVRADTDALYARFFPWDYAPEQAEDASNPYQLAARIVQGRIDRRILSEEFLRRMTADLLDEPGDLFITYFRLADIVSHSVWYYYDDRDWSEKPDPRNDRLLDNIIPESYRFVDEAIQQILEAHAGRANIVVISDHGFGSATGNYQSSRDLLTGNHRPDGVILAHGPDIAPGPIGHPTIMEVFPTLAYLLDVPIADTIPGTIAYGMLAESFTARHEPRYVERYDIDWQPVGTQTVDAEAQREEMNSLRGLGYIGEGVELTDDEGGRGIDFWGAEPSLVVGNLHAEVTYYLIQGDLRAAIRVTEELRRNAPELISALLSRVRSKIDWFRDDVPGGDDIAPQLDDYLARYEPSTG